MRLSLATLGFLALIIFSDEHSAQGQIFRDFRKFTQPRAPVISEPLGPPNLPNSSFSGEPLVTLLIGENIRLERDFGYRDSGGRWWPVPRRVVSDGASIPRIFWTPAGGPLDGPYRDAAIVHDYYCQTMSRNWSDVHRMFYEGMLARGVSLTQAKLKYYAVYRFGPRWYYTGGEPRRCGLLDRCFEGARPRVAHALPPEPVNMLTALADKRKIEAKDLSLVEIEALASSSSRSVDWAPQLHPWPL